jgi:capsular exopolysaccharide synthesis family protein
MELNRYLRVIRHRLWMIVACPILAAVAAGIVSFVLPPVYEAKVDLAVRPAQLLPSTDPNAAAVPSATILATYALFTTEPPLLNKVIADLGLKTTSDELVKEVKVTPDPVALVLHINVQDTNPARARDVANTLVADLIAQVKQIQQGETQSPNSRTEDNLVVLSPAVLPDKPVSPSKAVDVAIAFAAGLLLALATAYLLDYLDQSIKSDEELTQRLGLMSLGHIAFVPAGKGKRGELVSLEAQSHASEAYKALRTSVLFAGIDRELKEIVVTSAEPGEGKSRTAANLAIVLAQAGHKILLIDADFRRPSQHRMFARIRNVGLSNLILGDAAEADAVTAVESVTNLWLLTSGPTPPNPSELLGSGRMRELMSRLRANFTFVIVDTPPVNAVTDASILAAFANATILVVEHGRTSFPALGRAKQMLDRVGAHTIGAVFNKMRAQAGSYSYEYGYYAASSDHNRESGRQPQSESDARASSSGG